MLSCSSSIHSKLKLPVTNKFVFGCPSTVNEFYLKCWLTWVTEEMKTACLSSTFCVSVPTLITCYLDSCPVFSVFIGVGREEVSIVHRPTWRLGEILKL